MQAVHVKRVIKDYGELNNLQNEGIYVKLAKEDDLSKFYVMLIGPKTSPYENCLFFFEMEPGQSFNHKDGDLPYPMNPPKIIFKSIYTTRIHPNLYQPSGGGKVCLSILGTWPGPCFTPLITFKVIFYTILSILDNEPLRNEPGYEKGRKELIEKYTDNVQYICLLGTAKLIKNIFNDEPLPNHIKLFANDIREYFTNNKSDYISKLRTLDVKFANQKISLGPYGNTDVNQPYNYGAILAEIKNL